MGIKVYPGPGELALEAVRTAQVEIGRVLGMLAGILIFLVAAFILKAKPSSPIHRLFCAFAMADGVSTFAYDFSLVPMGESAQLHAYLVYVHAFLLFVGLLVCFGLLFPRPAIPARFRKPAVVAILAVTAASILWHALDPHAFWTGRRLADGTMQFSYGPAGLWMLVVWLTATAGIALRLLFLLRREPSPSHRRQAAFVLGGIILAYAPYATTTFLDALRNGVFGSVEGGALLVYVAAGANVVVLALVAFGAFAAQGAEIEADRRVVLWCLAAVGVLTLAAVLFPGRVVSDLLQVAGLVAYPLLLAYAIARYEILDIAPTVRRTALVSLAGTVGAVVFVLAEAGLENILQAQFAGALGVPLLAMVIAAVFTSLLFAPLAKLAKRLSRRFALGSDGAERDARRIEVYRHGLEAALEDGTIDALETRILTSMRESLGVTAEEHARLVGEIRGRRGTGA